MTELFYCKDCEHFSVEDWCNVYDVLCYQDDFACPLFKERKE